VVSLRVEAKPVRLIFLSTSSPNASLFSLLRSSASTPSSSPCPGVPSPGRRRRSVPAVHSRQGPVAHRRCDLALEFWRALRNAVPYATPYLLDPSTAGAKGTKRACLGTKVFFHLGCDGESSMAESVKYRRIILDCAAHKEEEAAYEAQPIEVLRFDDAEDGTTTVLMRLYWIIDPR
jgi:hypothetical protein